MNFEKQDNDRRIHRIVAAARQVHTALGPGFLETVYNRAFVCELKKSEFRVEREKIIKIWYGAHLVGKHRLDLVIDDAVILELKANRGIVQVHTAQMKSYLHATGYAIGLILNFGMPEVEFEIVEHAARQDQPAL